MNNYQPNLEGRVEGAQPIVKAPAKGYAHKLRNFAAAGLITVAAITPTRAYAGVVADLTHAALQLPKAIFVEMARYVADLPFLVSETIIDGSKRLRKKVDTEFGDDIKKGKKDYDKFIDDYITQRAGRKVQEQAGHITQWASLAERRLQDPYAALAAPYGDLVPKKEAVVAAAPSGKRQSSGAAILQALQQLKAQQGK